jgi:hypothetical protein
MNIPWWGYVILAGLAWGTYVPIIFFGGQLLTPEDGKGIGGRLASILCVGAAYFVLGVLIPLVLMSTSDNASSSWKSGGIVFSGLAGVAGAVGAICVIFASANAVKTAGAELAADVAVLQQQADDEKDPAKKAELEETIKAMQTPAAKKKAMAKYRIFIAPLIFSLAPIINTLLSLVWHPDPKTGEWSSFHFEMPDWKLPVGIVLVACGAFLVLFSKEVTELGK